MNESGENASGLIRSYAIRSRMTPAQKKTYEAFKDSDLLIPAQGEAGEKRLLNPASIFSLPKEKYLVDLGFGMGISTALMAEKNPGAGYIGIEVHAPGIARLLWEIKSRSLENIRIIYGDAFFVLRDMIPPESIDGFHIFFPDPWPKKRHRKRRLVTGGFLRLLASRLGERGYLYIVTDWQDYAGQIAEALGGVPELRVPENAVFPWRPETAFEKKGRRAGRVITEIYRVKQGIDNT
jgi:tRNA (guanine-N7-)-methyltransferase